MRWPGRGCGWLQGPDCADGCRPRLRNSRSSWRLGAPPIHAALLAPGNHPPFLSAVQNVLAKMVIERVPSVEMVRFVNSGTEACLSVVRLMRAYTGREKVRAGLGWACRGGVGLSAVERSARPFARMRGTGTACGACGPAGELRDGC